MDVLSSSIGNFDKDKFAKVLERKSTEKYILRLYVVNMSYKSIEAIKNIKQICDENLAGRYQLDVVDIRQQPDLAREGQIVATPTLVKESPLPFRRIIGNMSNTKRVLIALDLCPMAN